MLEIEYLDVMKEKISIQECVIEYNDSTSSNVIPFLTFKGIRL